MQSVMFVLACCVCTMTSIVLSKTKAICLFVTLFVLAATAEDAYFTTNPKGKEAFVGEDVQFDWEYDRTDVQEVRFGVIVNGSNKEVAIYVKKKDGKLVINRQDKEVEGIRDRVEIVPNRRASFTIKKVGMEDTGTYYCALIVGEDRNSFISKVKLTVVDLIIDKIASSKRVESWQGRRITVVCAARVPPGITNPKFSWMRIPSNTTVAKEYHDDIRSKSHLTITTYKGQDFEALQCRAETKTTVKFHIVNITKLSSPSPPRNLMAKRSFDKDNARPYILLHWDPPENNGGAAITGYILLYIIKGLPWKDAMRKETEDSEIKNLKLPNGNIYYAVVRAKNKVGTSARSNQIEINLEDDPHLSSINAGTQRHNLESLLLLLSFVAWLM